jgi:hypothetical protein
MTVLFDFCTSYRTRRSMYVFRRLGSVNNSITTSTSFLMNSQKTSCVHVERISTVSVRMIHLWWHRSRRKWTTSWTSFKYVVHFEYVLMKGSHSIRSPRNKSGHNSREDAIEDYSKGRALWFIGHHEFTCGIDLWIRHLTENLTFDTLNFLNYTLVVYKWIHRTRCLSDTEPSRVVFGFNQIRILY